MERLRADRNHDMVQHLSGTGHEHGPIPIGRPVANTSILILDSMAILCRANVTGEIYIGGHGLARGYLNRPELTAERFVANWLAPELSPRLYRTGDLGRFRSNGEIEYLGESIIKSSCADCASS